ncbi:MAG TPA: hypothetical protein VFM38_07510 [Candidatus Limnocylindrales bacterium]|nr:hypothetical protein [Candidatus Limnocylindrales bacterium]
MRLTQPPSAGSASDAGYVAQPDDRQDPPLVEPTDDGLAIWDRAVGIAARREAQVASVLDDKERAELHRLLRALMRAFPRSAHRDAEAKPTED